MVTGQATHISNSTVWYFFFQSSFLFNTGMLLNDLKKKKIGSYEIQEISAVTVRINPANMDRVEY